MTVGMDQKFRVVSDSAKGLRAGTRTPMDRLDPLDPILEEMFHVSQDLLEVNHYYVYVVL